MSAPYRDPLNTDTAPPAASGARHGLAGLALDEFLVTFETFFGYGPGEITAASRLREDLMFDSLEMLEIIMLLDEFAGTAVPMELIESISTVADVHHWVCVYASRRAS